MPTGAEVIVTELEAAGVELCFGLPGVHNLGLWEALRASSIRLVGVRHEQTAAYAADGYARATGRLGVAIVTTGPGAANTLGAVGEAWASRSPILIIATDIPSSLRRPGVYRGVLHEMQDQASLFTALTKQTFVGDATTPGPALIRQAIATALETPTRPTYLQVPTDQLRAQFSREDVEPISAAVRKPLSTEALEHACQLIDSAQNPLLWVGSGGRDASKSIDQLARRIPAPVLTTYGARGVLPPEHPCVVGLPPHIEPVGELWDQADLVIAIGSDFDGMATQNWMMGQPPQLVAVNIDRDDATKNYRADVVVEVDAGAGCELITERITERVPPSTEPVKNAANLHINRELLRASLDELERKLHHVRAQACAQLDQRALDFLDALAFALSPSTIAVCDMCIPGYWTLGCAAFSQPRRMLCPIGWGTLGFGFPAAIGAALNNGGDSTLAICGDGGFLFASGELATIAQEQIPLTTLIVDDGGYGMLRYDQDHAGTPRFGVDLLSPDFVRLGEAFGVKTETVDNLDRDLGQALERHLATNTPSVVVAKAPPLIPPPTTSPRWYRART